MIKHIIYGLIFLAVQQLHAQSTTAINIKGSVLDSASHKPLSLATIRLQNIATGLSVKRIVTNDNGLFQISVSIDRRETYQLSVDHVGYALRTIPVTVAAEAVDLGTIFLSSSVGQLKNVSVTATRPLVKQEIDRLSYDVQADPQAKAQTALEMMRRVPLISVDADDNIQLQGSSNYRVFLNGKPSALVTSNPKEVLRGMPAGTIQKVEVITTPPAKYDAEGLAGIINIVTVKKTSDGYNGNIGVRISPPYGQGINFTGAAKQNKLGISLTGNLLTRPAVSYRQENTRKTYGATPDILSQGIVNNSDGSFGFGGAELSMEFDSLHLLTASMNYSNNHTNQDYDRSSSFYIPGGTVLQSYDAKNDGRLHYKNVDLGTNYQLGFKRRKEQLLTFSYRYSYSISDQYSSTTSINRFQYEQPDNNQQNDAGFKEHTFQLDYVHPVKKLTIEAGAKTILRNNYSNSEGQIFISPVAGYADDPSRKNDFNYALDIYSAYNSYTLKLARWTIQGGVRSEYTQVNADFISTGTSLDMHYLNIVPSLSVLKTLANNNTIGIAITNRLMRPGITQLNPFVDHANPQLLSTGNTGLRPVVSHVFELNYNKLGKNSLTTRLLYYYVNNNVESVTKLLNDTVSQTSFDNVGQTRMVRLAISGNFSLTQKWGLNFNSLIFYTWIKGVYNGRSYTNQGPRTNTFISTNYKLNNTWQFGISGGYNRRYINLQGSSNDYVYYSATATCTIKNLTISGVLYNFLDPHYSFTVYNDTPDFYQSNSSDLIYRYAALNVNYRFGKLKGAIKRNKRGINNDDTSAPSN